MLFETDGSAHSDGAVVIYHFMAHGSVTLSASWSAVKLEQAADAFNPVQVSMHLLPEIVVF